MNIFRSRLRAPLLASASVCLMIAATPAIASDEDNNDPRPMEVIDSPHTANTDVISAAQNGFVTPDEAVDSPHITINNNFTPSQVFDPTNITGIGQVFTDAGGGSIGLCTGTLVNPRMVLFAAHCVNTRAATAYGANSGGVGVSIGFETNTRANGAGQTDELVRWLLGTGATQAGRFETNTAQALYNINQVFWDPRSTAPASCTAPTSCFLEADIATGVLDTPTRNIPTWALLFSPLANPSSINPATGTGYHVNIAGYGRNGNGTTGAVGNDFRRRAAENMLGALVSINTRNTFLFGTPGAPSRPQALYFLDFDDPARGTATANPLDFNGFRDNALPREGSTGPGDSGGPLILDRTFSKPVVIGTLSGGSTFFGGQPGGSYGTQSFYQPLFLYWDWIVANNPYHYVTATAGNKNWEDTTAWVTELDPNYQILSGGQLVNGLPTNLGGGLTTNIPGFGEMCFQSPSNSTNPTVNECENVTNGAIRNNVPNNPSDQSPVNGAAIERIVSGADGASFNLGLPNESAQADPGYSDTVRPAATLTNGLPGASGFTPNNVDGVRTTGQIGRYYDVTLRNTGVVTLSTAVTIDKFTVAGATSQLTVAAGGSLRSLTEINQLTGTVNNNGIITSVGDYLMLSGLLTGTGTINAPFTTSVMGGFAPGTVSTIGTMTFNGNLVMSSGSSYLVDLNANGTADRITVNGAANIGGTLAMTFGPNTRAGNTYTILTATGGVTGTFSGGFTAISAILTPRATYSANAVTITVDAGQYRNAIASSNSIAYAYAQLLDSSRSQAAAAGLEPLYAQLDLQNAATIASNLFGLAPAAQSTVESLGLTSIDVGANFLRDRLDSLDPSDMGGSVARYGQPVSVAAMSLSMGGGAHGYGAVKSDMGTPMIQEGALPEDMSAFLAGGFVDGDSRGMTGVGGRDKLDGWYVAGGIEKALDDVSVLGASFSYNELVGDGGVLPSQTVHTGLFQATLYGKTQFGGVTLDARVSGGKLSIETDREVTVVGTPYQLHAEDDVRVLDTEVGIGGNLGAGAFSLKPRAALRSSLIDFGEMRESGGAPAMRFDRGAHTSLQGRAGLTIEHDGPGVRPFANATFVHEFNDQANFLTSNFVNSTGAPALFALNGQDKDWFEVGGGVTFKTDLVELSLSADSTISRKDVSVQTYRGSISFRF